MDRGSIIIAVTAGEPRVVRCEDAPGGGTQLVPAQNAGELASATRAALVGLGADLSVDALYPCPIHLIEAARFRAMELPHDAITPAQAKDILYPDLGYQAGWQRLHRDIEAGRLRAYMVGPARSPKRYVSRAEVEALAADPPAKTRGRGRARASS